MVRRCVECFKIPAIVLLCHVQEAAALIPVSLQPLLLQSLVGAYAESGLPSLQALVTVLSMSMKGLC